MKRSEFIFSLAALAVLATSASAQTGRVGVHVGGGFHRHRSFIGLGLGWDPWYSHPVYSSPVYRNAFTGDVTYAERTSNDFRSRYERRKGDPLGLKEDIQRLDQDLEKMRSEAERYGSATLRGSELMRDALDRADAIDERLRRGDDPLVPSWRELYHLLEDLRREYRAS